MHVCCFIFMLNFQKDTSKFLLEVVDVCDLLFFFWVTDGARTVTTWLPSGGKAWVTACLIGIKVEPSWRGCSCCSSHGRQELLFLRRVSKIRFLVFPVKSHIRGSLFFLFSLANKTIFLLYSEIHFTFYLSQNST